MEQPHATFWSPERYWGLNFPWLLTSGYESPALRTGSPESVN